MNPIYLALDRLPSIQAIRELLHAVGGQVKGGKLHHLIDRYGAKSLGYEIQGYLDFLWADLKLYDTPDTVLERANEFKTAGFHAVSVHIKGGAEMIEAAQKTNLHIIGITELTSMTDAQCVKHYGLPRCEQVLKLALEGKRLGITSIVCSANEVGLLSGHPSLQGIEWIIPGTRSAGVDVNDQKNVVPPADAIRSGATSLVIGRQIVKASDPLVALNAVLAEIAPALKQRSAI